jgi:hypothetical protein
MRIKTPTNTPISALLVGSLFGGLSFFLNSPDVDTLIPFLLPGCLFAMIFSGNVHAFSTRAVAVGNFMFYAGGTFLLLLLFDKYGLWKKYNEKYKSK